MDGVGISKDRLDITGGYMIISDLFIGSGTRKLGVSDWLSTGVYKPVYRKFKGL